MAQMSSDSRILFLFSDVFGKFPRRLYNASAILTNATMAEEAALQ
jgi:hypothetical protein